MTPEWKKWQPKIFGELFLEHGSAVYYQAWFLLPILYWTLSFCHFHSTELEHELLFIKFTDMSLEPSVCPYINIVLLLMVDKLANDFVFTVFGKVNKSCAFVIYEAYRKLSPGIFHKLLS